MPTIKAEADRQRFWPVVGIPVRPEELKAIDKAAIAESLKAERGPISRAAFCREILMKDKRVREAINGAAKKTA